jgi:hypothetical protein
MKRTQIYLDDELYEALRRVAFEQRKSIACVAREALASHLAGAATPSAPRALRERAVAYAPRVLPARKPRAANKLRAKPTRAQKLTRAELRELEKNPLYHIIGLYASDKPDAGINHDYYLYHEDKD